MENNISIFVLHENAVLKFIWVLSKDGALALCDKNGF